jgi:hypothetical protein
LLVLDRYFILAVSTNSFLERLLSFGNTLSPTGSREGDPRFAQLPITHNKPIPHALAQYPRIACRHTSARLVERLLVAKVSRGLLPLSRF